MGQSIAPVSSALGWLIFLVSMSPCHVKGRRFTSLPVIPMTTIKMVQTASLLGMHVLG